MLLTLKIQPKTESNIQNFSFCHLKQKALKIQNILYWYFETSATEPHLCTKQLSPHSGTQKIKVMPFVDVGFFCILWDVTHISRMFSPVLAPSGSLQVWQPPFLCSLSIGKICFGGRETPFLFCLGGILAGRCMVVHLQMGRKAHLLDKIHLLLQSFLSILYLPSPAECSDILFQEEWYFTCSVSSSQQTLYDTKA